MKITAYVPRPAQKRMMSAKTVECQGDDCKAKKPRNFGSEILINGYFLGILALIGGMMVKEAYSKG